VEYAHEHGCPWNKMTCAAAAKEDHLHVLKYAHENGCPWGETTCRWAARGGHIDVLRHVG